MTFDDVFDVMSLCRASERAYDGFERVDGTGASSVGEWKVRQLVGFTSQREEVSIY